MQSAALNQIGSSVQLLGVRMLPCWHPMRRPPACKYTKQCFRSPKPLGQTPCARREVVERRTFTVTGQHVSADEVDRLIETGESETIFAKAILEQGRGHVRV